MDEFFNRLLINPLAELTAQQLLDSAMRNFYAFTLVLVRMSGLMTIGPIFGQSIVPANIRILLVLALSFLITPALHIHSRVASESLNVPSTILDFAWVGIGEFSLGLVLGLGVLTILSGLQLAGEIIDQQTGIALGEISNPGFEINGSVTGQFLFMLGVTLLLIMEPVGGHLMMVSVLVETFQTLPVGEAYVSASAVELLRDLVHQSLVLGVQVAAPLLATMTLVALTMGFLGHTVPQVNVLIVGFPIRAMISLLVIAVTLSGVGRVVIDLVPSVIDDIRQILTAV